MRMLVQNDGAAVQLRVPNSFRHTRLDNLPGAEAEIGKPPFTTCDEANRIEVSPKRYGGEYFTRDISLEGADILNG